MQIVFFGVLSAFVAGFGLWYHEVAVMMVGVLVGIACLALFVVEIQDKNRQVQAEASKKATEHSLRIGEEVLGLIQMSLQAQLPHHSVHKGVWGNGGGLCLDIVHDDYPNEPVMSINLDKRGIFVRLFYSGEDITGSLSPLKAFEAFVDENRHRFVS